MKILVLIYHGLSPDSGISKKILSQVKGLKENGHDVSLCTYYVDPRGHRVREIDGTIIADYGTGLTAALRKRCSYRSIVHWAREHKVDMVYVRSFHNANPFTIDLFRSLRKAGIRIAMEIPTYPYDSEYANFPISGKLELIVDRLFRHLLARHTDAIVTFSDYARIFGQRAICISNGVDFDALPLRHSRPHPVDEIHLIAVAEVHYWHGFDRLVHGLGLYYQKAGPDWPRVYFHLVGGMAPAEKEGSAFAPGILTLIHDYSLQDKVILHGALHGEALDNVFDIAQLAIGSLARHRTGIRSIKTLKNREYAARGIPFIYSEQDADFDHQPYVLKVSADESHIDIEALVRFYRSKMWNPTSIRESVRSLSWKEQMRTVTESIIPSKQKA